MSRDVFYHSYLISQKTVAYRLLWLFGDIHNVYIFTSVIKLCVKRGRRNILLETTCCWLLLFDLLLAFYRLKCIFKTTCLLSQLFWNLSVRHITSSALQKDFSSCHIWFCQLDSQDQ